MVKYVPRTGTVEMQVLGYIVNNPSSSVPDICRGLGKDPSYTYKIVRKLESGHYVYRRRGEGKRTSGKSKIYYPTNMGRRFISGPQNIIPMSTA
ncbi:MAG: MarR family transcriptional regulator [Candidatus Aenigmarchaeota archaeon]|nr:MarR family transcriptional regulator [Candidatus Aenigmarchaeota archaeon]